MDRSKRQDDAQRFARGVFWDGVLVKMVRATSEDEERTAVEVDASFVLGARVKEIEMARGAE